jgi:hypothetical protein
MYDVVPEINCNTKQTIQMMPIQISEINTSLEA